MTQKIIFNFSYNIFCNNCGKLIVSNVLPIYYGDNYAEFDISSYVCGCSNNSDFNVAKSEIKRLKIEN